MTIGERLAGIEQRMMDGASSPQQMRKDRAMLSGMLLLANEARLQAELEYRKRVAEIRKTTKSRVDAEDQAMCEPAYQAWQSAINVCESILAMDRACRDNLRSLDSEIGLQR